MSPTKSSNDFNFEAAIEQLQKTVRDLESGDLSLEDSLKAFEQGVKLSRECEGFLKTAKKKIEVLTKDGLQDFNSP